MKNICQELKALVADARKAELFFLPAPYLRVREIKRICTRSFIQRGHRPPETRRVLQPRISRGIVIQSAHHRRHFPLPGWDIRLTSFNRLALTSGAANWPTQAASLILRALISLASDAGAISDRYWRPATITSIFLGRPVVCAAAVLSLVWSSAWGMMVSWFQRANGVIVRKLAKASAQQSQRFSDQVSVGPSLPHSPGVPVPRQPFFIGILPNHLCSSGCVKQRED